MMINEQKEEDEKIANYNSKALNAIFSAVDVNQFKLIATCESVKEAWEILQTAYEGTAAVRMSKLQILALRFEDLRIEESETIATFNAKLCGIANEAQALGKKYSDCKLVRKALRSLPERFAYKLMGSLQTFELNLIHNRRDKEKSVDFQAEIPKSTFALEDNDDMSESLALMTKNLGKFLKMMDENSNKPKSGKSFNSQKDKTNFNSFDDRKNRRIQCRECEGFGHIQVECANTLKQMRKSLTTTWSDEECEGSQENDHTTFSSKMMNNHREHVATNHRYVPAVQYNATCLTSSTAIGEKDMQISDSETNSDDDEPSIEEIQQMYNKIFQKWLEICKINKSLDEQIIVLNKKKESVKVEILKFTNLELLHTQKMMKLDFGKKKLDEILSIGKPCRDHHGLGYTGESSTSKTIFVKETKPVQSIFDKSKKFVFQKPKSKRCIPICHFCNLTGHIRPKYFRFKNILRNGMHFDSPTSSMLQQRSKLKSDFKCFVANISLKACTDDTWYFDSGCSKHMTGDKGKIERLSNLKANLISISQLCDQNLFVTFNKNKCQVFDEIGRCVLIDSRSSDNWHLNFKNLTKIVNTGAVLGVPKLNKKNSGVCSAYQLGKQKKGTHKVLQHINTSRTLELLHMGLMGPMQVESLGGKRYVFVCVDNFSRFTWVYFIREKSNTFQVFKKLCKKLVNEKNDNIGKIVRIRSDHGKEFEHAVFTNFCENYGIAHEFSASKTPQQNAEAVSTACYTINRVYLRPGTKKTPYEIWKVSLYYAYLEAFNKKSYISNGVELAM
ncbi:hypothetical protein Pfo_020352 [Paulownia fortunei]|nr:hypothetical protein Pfo_020352 [Paulownia fortunei]